MSYGVDHQGAQALTLLRSFSSRDAFKRLNSIDRNRDQAPDGIRRSKGYATAPEEKDPPCAHPGADGNLDLLAIAAS